MMLTLARRRQLAWVAGLLVVSAVTLRAMGRVWWCQCGQPDLWTWHVWSRHNSQHVIDPYTFTHVLHGVLFYGILHLLLGKRAPGLRLVLAVAVESAWEILENTNRLIERYREATISLDYVGDSVINSLADILACAGGYGLASLVPVWMSVAGVLLTETILLAWIRDNLLLNMVMLAWPVEAIRRWQGGS